MKTISFLLCTKLLQSLRIEAFYSKKTIILWRRLQSEAIFKTQSRSTINKKIFFTETSEANIRHLSPYLFFVFLQMKLSSIICFWLCNENLWCIIKTTNVKIKPCAGYLWCLFISWIFIVSKTLIRNCPVCIGETVKD